jgi:glycosyltransferase involved in cell wall biosynthesis
MGRICLITPGQPSINPRLVKEADALVDAGHDVHVLCSHMVSWADEADKKLLATRKWSCLYVGGNIGSWLYAWTRLRHGVVRRFSGDWSADGLLGIRALTRVTPELCDAAVRYRADLYIAHYSGALAAAARAANENGARVGFDAEDFETGYYDMDTGPKKIDRLIDDVERKCLPACCYVTAASPGIAAAYQSKYGISMPRSVLNVFPLTERPPRFRDTSSNGPLRLYWFSQTIGPGRGVEDVIRAMGKLRSCDIELHLRGLARPQHCRDLQELAARSEVRPNAVVLHSPLPPDEMIRAASEFDVGLALEQPVSLNRDICLTNKIFAYLLAGNAIAATATTGQKPIIDTIGKVGFLYQPGDVDGLAEGLRYWSQDREQLQIARQQAWWHGTRTFNWDIEKKKFLEVVGGILSEQEYAQNAR